MEKGGGGGYVLHCNHSNEHAPTCSLSVLTNVRINERCKKKDASKAIQTAKQSNTTHPRQSLVQVLCITLSLSLSLSLSPTPTVEECVWRRWMG